MLRSRLRFIGLVLLLLPLLAWGVVELAIWQTTLPALLRQPAASTTTLLDAHGQRIAHLPSDRARRQHPIALAQMQPLLATATVALEDRRFYQHGGVDWQALAAATLRNLRHGQIISGASTLTQQLIKNTSPPQPRSFFTKLGECLAAIKLERRWSKQAILERYLNEVEYGQHLRGVEAAAQHYFGCTALQLSNPQAVFLAGLPQAPSRFNPQRHPTSAAARYQRCLAQLRGLGLLPQSESAAWATPPVVLPEVAAPLLAPHFVQAVSQQLRPNSGSITCTLDLALQSRVETLAHWHAQRLLAHDATQLAIIIIEHATGAVRAWYGSNGWQLPEGRIDGVTLPRSCGSTLKPFLYLQAIDQRLLTAATLLPDTPDAIRTRYFDYDPCNYDHRFWGPVRVREALANSLNVPAVVTLARTGARSTFDYIQHAGIRLPRTLGDYGAGLILGNAEVRLIDIAAAYGALAHDGITATPRLRSEQPQRHRSIASAEAAQIIADILCDDSARRKTFGPFSPLAFEEQRIPVKTGTSSGFRDAWTIGLTSKHCVGVWVGNYNGKPMHELASVTGPAPLWRDLINLLLQAGDTGLPAPQPSARLQQASICTLTGLQPTADSPGQRQEWFISGTAPTQSASLYLKRNDADKAQLFLPSDYAQWCASEHNYLAAHIQKQEPLRIITPRPGSTFALDAHLPRARQKLDLRAIGANPGQPLQWTLNGHLLAATQPDNSVSWPLVPGKHQLVVSDGTASASASFTVDP